MTEAAYIYYPHPTAAQVEVEVLSAQRALQSTGLLLDVINVGYTRQFEAPAGLWVPEGTVAARYAPNDKNIERYRKRTAEHYTPDSEGRGSTIVAVHPAPWQRGEYFHAFGKVSPALRATEGQFEGCYLNDVIARTPYAGFGSIAMHAALTQTGQDPNAALTLEAFEGSPVNEWYKSLGLERVGPSGMFVFDKQHKLPQTCYTTPASAGIGDVVMALEAKRPQLSLAQAGPAR